MKRVKVTSFSYFIRNATPAQKAEVYEKVLEGVARRQANLVSPAEGVGIKCHPHPKAPHGFARQASHSNGRYTCTCEGWDPYEAGFQEGYTQGMRDTYEQF